MTTFSTTTKELPLTSTEEPSWVETETAGTDSAETQGSDKRSLSVGFVIGAALLTVAVLGGWFFAYSLVLTGFQEHSSQSRLYERFRSELANETAPLGDPIRKGQVVAIISSRHGGLGRLVVVEGSNSHQLASGPGHLPSTPLPGQVGDSVILGRALTYGAPFVGISHLKRGELIFATTQQGAFTYKVEDVRYPGDLQPAALKSGQSRITLVTASGRSWPGAWSTSHAVYVDAILVRGHAQPVLSPLPKASGSALPMHSDSHALIPLVLWLAALIIAAGAVGWSWIRWGRAQTWLIGAPILLGVMWGSTGALTRFLPNLI